MCAICMRKHVKTSRPWLFILNSSHSFLILYIFHKIILYTQHLIPTCCKMLFVNFCSVLVDSFGIFCWTKQLPYSLITSLWYICSPTRYTKCFNEWVYSSLMLARHVSDHTGPSSGAFCTSCVCRLWYVVIRVLLDTYIFTYVKCSTLQVSVFGHPSYTLIYIHKCLRAVHYVHTIAYRE